jgi:VIT1/CCC1 family predicted Fe2+/Mn2+ transporter
VSRVFPRVPHGEAHFTGRAVVRDVIIGMSDGLTVPFALAAGLSGAVASSAIVLIAGIAEVAAGSIAMGLGGYLAAASEVDVYRAELERERREIRDVPHAEVDEVRAVFRDYGLEGAALEAATSAVTSNPKSWLRFMMREELGLEEPDPSRALISAATIGLSYIAGGMIPLAPYALGLPIASALKVSVVLTLLALLILGVVKGYVTSVSPRRSAVQTAVVGAVAAGAAYMLARAVGGIGR